MIKKYESESENDSSSEEVDNNTETSCIVHSSDEESTTSSSIGIEPVQEILVINSTPIKTCSAILKSGVNKGKLCGITTQSGTYCKRHS
jgi:hypothetical protein